MPPRIPHEQSPPQGPKPKRSKGGVLDGWGTSELGSGRRTGQAGGARLSGVPPPRGELSLYILRRCRAASGVAARQWMSSDGVGGEGFLVSHRHVGFVGGSGFQPTAPHRPFHFQSITLVHSGFPSKMELHTLQN